MVETIITEMGKSNFSFLILVVGVAQLVCLSESYKMWRKTHRLAHELVSRTIKGGGRVIHDITFCVDECDNYKCFRNSVHMPKNTPVSMSYLKGTEECCSEIAGEKYER